MLQSKQYDINTPEEFIDAWEKLTPQIFAKAEELHISLEKEDGSPMDSFNIFLTGETTAEKLHQAGADEEAAKRTLQLATEIQNLVIKLRKNTHPKVTLTQIKEGFGNRHLWNHIQQKLEEKASWVVIASLAWYGYSNDGRGILLPAVWAERHRPDLVIMSDAGELAAVRHRHQPRRLVFARGGQELAVRAERHRRDLVVMGDAGALAAVRHHPEPRRLVVACGGEGLAVRAERYRSDR